jgi:hypothetical protein
MVPAGVVTPGAAIQGHAAHAAARTPRPVGECTPGLVVHLLRACRVADACWEAGLVAITEQHRCPGMPFCASVCSPCGPHHRD